jgi:hypothetical protein
MDQGIRQRIGRMGKTLTVICMLSKVFFVVLAVVSLTGVYAALFRHERIMANIQMFRQNTLFRILENTVDFRGMEPRHVAAIGCGVTALTFGTLALYIHGFQRLLTTLISSEKSFSRELALRIRRGSYAVLPTALYNPLAGVAIFLVTTLFSYLVEYGAFIQEKADQTSRIQEEMIVSFAEITENKSGQTGQHVRRVSEYSRILAQEMGLGPEAAERLRLASTMHDIGKLMIPSEILEKPGRLTDEEYATMKQHTTYGGALLEHVEGDVIGTARTVAMEHHERPDGRGYPLGLREISLEGRIVAVADVYDALTSRRSYKEAWDEQRAYDEILRGSGSQFDADVVEAFKRSYDRIREVTRIYRDA